MDKKGLIIIFFVLLLVSTVSVIADEEQEHSDEHQQLDEKAIILDGYEIELVTEPESPKIGKELHLVVHIENQSDGESVSGLHVEIKITKMNEQIVLYFEEGHAHEEDELGHYALHYMFEEEGYFKIHVKIEDVGVADDTFHVTVESSFLKEELTSPLVFTATGIGVAALIVVGVKMRET